MTETGLGWPDRDAYDAHANVKLTAEQLTQIQNSGQPISQWIREAIVERLIRESYGDKGLTLHRKVRDRINEIIGDDPAEQD
jgi:hypothetical protein